jgi:hypothetical protein
MPVPGPERAGFAAPGMAVQTCVTAGMPTELRVAASFDSSSRRITNAGALLIRGFGFKSLAAHPV